MEDLKYFNVYAHCLVAQVCPCTYSLIFKCKTELTVNIRAVWIDPSSSVFLNQSYCDSYIMLENVTGLYLLTQVGQTVAKGLLKEEPTIK